MIKPACEVNQGDVVMFGNMYYYVVDIESSQYDQVILRCSYTDAGYWDCINGLSVPSSSSILDAESQVNVVGHMPGD